MWSTPSSTARRSTARAPSGSLGAPNTPGPASCIAPKPMRLTGLSPRNDVLSIAHRLRLQGRADKKSDDPVTATTRLALRTFKLVHGILPVGGACPRSVGVLVYYMAGGLPS